MAWILAESRNRIFVLGASLVVLVGVIIFSILFFPENTVVYLYQPDPREESAFKRLAEEFKLKSGKDVDVRVSADNETLPGVICQESGPKLAVFHSGAGMESVRGRFMRVPDTLKLPLLPFSDRQIDDAAGLMVASIAIDPAGYYWNQSLFAAQGSNEPRSLAQILSSLDKSKKRIPSWLILPGGNDQALLDFLSALVISFWGTEACQLLSNASISGMDFDHLLDLDIAPGAQTGKKIGSGIRDSHPEEALLSPRPATLRTLLDTLVAWTSQERLQARWFQLSREQVVNSPSLASTCIYFMPAGFRSDLDNHLTMPYRFANAMPASLWYPRIPEPLSGCTLFLARTTNTARRDDALLSQIADDFFAFVVSSEGQRILAEQTNALVPGQDASLVRDELREVSSAYAMTRRVEPGLWRDGFDRITASRWTADAKVSFFCRKIREHLQEGLAALALKAESAEVPPVPAASSP